MTRIQFVNSCYGIYPEQAVFPDYFRLFLLSCKYNPDHEWLVVTDKVPQIPGVPENVRFLEFSREEFVERLRERTGFTVSPAVLPYKFCDFRIFFGVLFREWLNADYWGYCDIDLMYGYIDKYLQCPGVADFDIITTRGSGKFTGHFTLFRNL